MPEFSNSDLVTLVRQQRHESCNSRTPLLLQSNLSFATALSFVVDANEMVDAGNRAPELQGAFHHVIAPKIRIPEKGMGPN